MASGQNWIYDLAGNVTGDPEGRTFTYDAENKQIEVKNSTNATVGQYCYDGDGKRIKKVVPSTGETTIFIYDAGAKLIGEYSTIVQPVQDAKVAYLTSDHLGSPRINTDRDGNVTSRTDYMPYGEEIIAHGGRSANEGYTADNVRQGFTGYENDEETGLGFAQARLFNSRLGRFASSDPLQASASVGNPQKWNRYSYVINRPLHLIDPSGLDIQFLNQDARYLTLGTLPEAIRKKVEKVIDKDGKLKKGSLDKIKSKDQNFLDLKAIVNDQRTLEVTTGSGFQNPGEDRWEFSFQNASEVRESMVANLVAGGMTKEDAQNVANEPEGNGDLTEVALYGVFQTPEQTNGNARVTISDGTGAASSMPIERRVGTAGHETFGHALLFFQGKVWGHDQEEQGGKPYSHFTAIEDRSVANFRGQQKLATPKAIKPSKRQ